MSHDFTIQNEKLNQVAPILKELNLGAWLVFVRETTLSPDPAHDLIVGLPMTWMSAFIVTDSDERVAIVGRFDADSMQRMGGFKRIIPYDANIFPELVAVLRELDPASIAINFSESDPAADGLSHGLWRRLTTALGETPYKHRLTSAGPLIASLRGRKTPTEVQRIRAAIRTTEQIIDKVAYTVSFSQNEVEIFEMLHDFMAELGVRPSFSPSISAGPDSAVGHALPDEAFRTGAGVLLHIDLGVEQDDYVSDLQRVWYFMPAGEDSIPEEIQNGFDAVRGAILAAADILKPGVMGWEVDAAARAHIIKMGYPEYQHAVGHHIGRSVHDGAAVLGPKWERYGKTPEIKVEAGNVFTLELGVHVSGFGFVGLEEDVLVTSRGLEWLSAPQTEIMIVG